MQVFSKLVEMKFKPASERATHAVGKRNEKIIRAGREYLDIYDALSMSLQADRKIEAEQSRRLRFNVSLSSEHFLVGN